VLGAEVTAVVDRITLGISVSTLEGEVIGVSVAGVLEGVIVAMEEGATEGEREGKNAAVGLLVMGKLVGSTEGSHVGLA
jgi:hypothetical protein